MRICFIMPFYDDRPTSFIQEPGRYAHIDAMASALARRKHDVVVVQAFRESRTEWRNSAEFRYARTPHRPGARLAGGAFGVDFLARGNLKQLMRATIDAQPDVVHMYGLALLQPLLELSAWSANTQRPLTVSYHGGAPREEPWLKGIQHRILKRCHRVFFPTRSNADGWLTRGLLQEEQVAACMEVSTAFVPADRAVVRLRTGMTGDPVFVWNGGLTARKDPLTALRGFSLIRKRWPHAGLYMIYLTNEMQGEVERAIASDPALVGAVEMRGRIPHTEVEDFLNSADFLIHSARSEIGCFGVLEAMACGVIPVVTDIPLFRTVTREGQCGILFPVGDHQSMAEKTLQFDLGSIGSMSRQIRELFARSFSYDAIAEIYEDAFISGLGRQAAA